MEYQIERATTIEQAKELITMYSNSGWYVNSFYPDYNEIGYVILFERKK